MASDPTTISDTEALEAFSRALASAENGLILLRKALVRIRDDDDMNNVEAWQVARDAIAECDKMRRVFVLKAKDAETHG